MTDSRNTKEPVLAALLSFFFPGAGQIYNGRIGAGIGWFFGTILGYIALVLPGLIAHGFCIYNAYMQAKAMGEDHPFLLETAPTRGRLEGRRIDVDGFVAQLEKLGQLRQNGVLNDVEFHDRKEHLISDLGGRELHTSPEDFLLALSRLKEKDVLDEQDMSRVKSMVL